MRERPRRLHRPLHIEPHLSQETFRGYRIRFDRGRHAVEVGGQSNQLLLDARMQSVLDAAAFGVRSESKAHPRSPKLLDLAAQSLDLSKHVGPWKPLEIAPFVDHTDVVPHHLGGVKGNTVLPGGAPPPEIA